ncbi:MAG TPA: hypothetical protein VF122_02655 [Caulobacteraceae bacterium]
MKLIISSLADAHTVIRVAKPSHVITLLGHDSIDDAPKFGSAERHLKMLVHDICEPCEGLIHPTEAMVEKVLTFGRGWTGETPMLVHCWAGVSRSSAAAFMLACERCPETDEQVIAQRLRKASRAATPNELMVRLADDLLGRGGRMVDAVRAIGVGDYMHPNPPYELPTRF